MNGNHRITARKLALIAVMAGAGQAQAQAVSENGWARISPGAGYGFGFWMEVATRSTEYAGERPNPYDLLYTVKPQDTRAARRLPDAIDPAATYSSATRNVEGVLSRLENAGVMTRAIGVNEPVPMMIFTGAISSRCSSGLQSCDRSNLFDMPAPNL